MMLPLSRIITWELGCGNNSLPVRASPYLGMILHAPRLLVAAALLTSLSCGRVASSAEAATVPVQQATTPRLIVFITVDQLRADMLDRYRADLKFGFARLMRGARFVNGFQDHAITETAPGHASTMSGRFPASTGIVSNSAGVGD